VRIFSRRREWDYNWLKDFPAELSLARHYEFARYALLRVANDPQFVFPDGLPFGAMPYLVANKAILGPILSLAANLAAKVKFPQMIYREARELLTVNPATLAAMIAEFSNAERPTQQKVNTYLRSGAAEKAAEVLAQLDAKSPAPKPKCGAGARNRREQTDLKYLGATKLLDSPMIAPDAIVLTTDTLGRPLLANESEWSRARRCADKILEPYHAEAAVLWQALSEKRVLKSASYLDGKIQIEWE
jgi:hypothetical protein